MDQMRLKSKETKNWHVSIEINLEKKIKIKKYSRNCFIGQNEMVEW